jgi:hypothetical protein
MPRACISAARYHVIAAAVCELALVPETSVPVDDLSTAWFNLNEFEFRQKGLLITTAPPTGLINIHIKLGAAGESSTVRLHAI